MTSGRSIFRTNGLEKLSSDYLPSRLPHREGHEAELLRLFTPAVLSGGTISRSVMIYGASGTGKTATARRIALQLKRIATENLLNLKCVHINCRYASSNFGLVQMLTNTAAPHMSTRGYGASELIQATYSFLDDSSESLFLVLDDVDQFVKRCGPDGLYELMRLSDVSPGKKKRLILLLIGVEDITRLPLENWAKSVITRLSAHFDPYGFEEIGDILKDRIDESFIEGAVPNDIALLISRIVEKFGFGSARYGIELLQAAGLEAEYEGLGRVCPEYVRRAQARMDGMVDLGNLSGLPPGHIALTRAIARAFGETEEAYVPISKVLDRADKHHGGGEAESEALSRLHFEGLIDRLGDRVGLMGTTLARLEGWLEKLPED